MLKVFLILFLFISLIYPISIFASHTQTTLEEDITVTLDKNPVYQNSGTVTVTVKSESGIFQTSQDYTFSAKNTSNPTCSLASGTHKPKDSKLFEATWNIQLCAAEIGTWNFQMWAGNSFSYNPNGLIVKNFPFYLEQTDGGVPSISALNSPLGPNDKPRVILNNAQEGTTYTFWWDGSRLQLAYKETAKSSGTLEFTINKTSDVVDFSQPGVKKLCMEIGDHGLPLDLTCRYPTFFEFKIIAPTEQPKCSIEPSFTPTDEDDISLACKNLTKNTDFRADLDGQRISIVRNSRDEGAVTIPLGKNLSIGSHRSSLYMFDTDELIYTTTFNVGTKPPPGAPGGQLPGVGVIKCKEPTASDFDPNIDQACSSAAGQECRAGRGIDTAIGCIPTHPVELVRGFVRFAIGIAGGIALLLMIFGAFTMITSAGNPDRINEGRERFSSAVIGLLVIIFAVLLMKLIGVDILGLDKFLGV